jgi:CRP-like cAMP-binding protein
MLTILERVDLLQTADFFRDVRTQSLARVAAVMREVSFEARQKLYNESEAPDALFIVLEGEVSLTRTGSAERRLSRPQAAGALAVLANRPHMEAATAAQRVRTLRIGQEALFDAMAEDFNITRGILRALARMVDPGRTEPRAAASGSLKAFKPH